MNSSTVRRFSITMLAASLALGGIACGKIAEKATEKALEKGIEAGTGAKVDIDSDGGGFKVETDEGSWSIDGEAGEFRMETEDGSSWTGTGMPEDWPNDIDVPKTGEVMGQRLEDADGLTTGVVGETDASAEDVIAFYDDALSDWTEEGRNSNTGGDHSMLMVSYTRGNRSLHVTASQQSGEATQFSLLHQVSRGDGD